MLNNISFAVMAGGEAKRFGSDKTKALLNNKPLYSYGVELGLSVTNDVMLISKDSSKYQPHISDVRYIEDEYNFQAPMAGIMTALKNAKYDNVFVLSADAPLCQLSVVELLHQKMNGYDATIPEVNGRYYNLSAIYSKTFFEALQAQSQINDYKLTNAYKKSNVLFISQNEFHSNQISSFVNINTLDDLKIASNLLI